MIGSPNANFQKQVGWGTWLSQADLDAESFELWGKLGIGQLGIKSNCDVGHMSDRRATVLPKNQVVLKVTVEYDQGWWRWGSVDSVTVSLFLHTKTNTIQRLWNREIQRQRHSASNLYMLYLLKSNVIKDIKYTTSHVSCPIPSMYSITNGHISRKMLSSFITNTK